jgi:hypothetical protein
VLRELCADSEDYKFWVDHFTTKNFTVRWLFSRYTKHLLVSLKVFQDFKKRTPDLKQPNQTKTEDPIRRWNLKELKAYYSSLRDLGFGGVSDEDVESAFRKLDCRYGEVLNALRHSLKITPPGSGD